MPTGIYKRTKKHHEQIKRAFAKGRTPAARKKAVESINKIWEDPEKRKETSRRTREIMNKPEVKKKHLAALKKARKKHGVGFKGGNGQPPLAIILTLAKDLEPKGYIREYAIKTKGHNTGLSCPTSYKVDFGNPKTKKAIEVDGPCHRSFARQESDQKKERVLKALGWAIKRVIHK